MLNSREIDGAKVLLNQLPEEDVLSLAQTITKCQIEISSVKVAIEAILSYSETATELLRRKKIRRDDLFRYLASENVIVSPKAEKHEIIEKVLEYWGKTQSRRNEIQTVNIEDRCLGTATGAHTETQPATNSRSSPSPTSDNTDQVLAEQFTSWFFQMLNSYHPFSQESPSESFGPHHFFRDCQMKMISATPDIRRDIHNGAEEVSRRLLAFVKEEQLKLNPNLDPGGVKGMSNPHGLKLLMVCGTVHLHGRFVGIFEQQFGLVRDPDSQNNLKIKFTNLKLKRENAEITPTLQQTNQMLCLEM